MFRIAFRFTFVLAALGLLAPSASPAQEIVHAMIGTVSSIDSGAKTITLLQGTSHQVFKATVNPSVRLAFDKKMAESTQPAANFQTLGAYVVVLYFGGAESQTAVALRSLGKGPFSSTSGEVSSWDRHRHVITVTDSAGAIHQFNITPETIAETNMGCLNGSRYQADKGEKVRIVSDVEKGGATALFVRSM